MDRISELPEVVLQYILSFLPIKQVVQSTVLSTRWKHIWTTFPNLVFDETYFDTTLWWSPKNKKNPEVQKATIVDSDVEELNLEFGYFGIDYILPQRVLVAKSLTVLILYKCKLESTCGDIYLPSLKKLSLSHVDADDQIFQNLIAGCPVIESMMFRECRGLKSIKASNVPKVMAITLEGNALESLELEAFNLYYLSMRQVTIGSGFNLLHCKNLRLLSLCVVYISNEWLNNNLPGLALLEKLELKICFELKTIKISNHHLKSLDLDRCAYLIEVEIDAPKLSTFIYYGTYQASISSNALALSQATYNLRCLNVPDPTDVEKIEFLSKLSNSKLLELSVQRAENAIIPKELRETLPSPSYNVKHLMVSISKSFTRDEIGELVDSLLWISPLPDILSMECSKNSKPDFDQISLKFFKQSYNCKTTPFLLYAFASHARQATFDVVEILVILVVTS
ncbi:F-box/FBD/LRR-repeat protein At3g26920-like [Quercus robur]|uniref:F-box/FBD/LRR-repeat protein At3g26920-like n=1 Tax=Quercus robur TaxID=38942 RepID=UPI002161904A|nr:F-box/FBD/LRR-repeat protein At3g26920-like [Quercus robur]